MNIKLRFHFKTMHSHTQIRKQWNNNIDNVLRFCIFSMQHLQFAFFVVSFFVFFLSVFKHRCPTIDDRIVFSSLLFSNAMTTADNSFYIEFVCERKKEELQVKFGFYKN